MSRWAENCEFGVIFSDEIGRAGGKVTEAIDCEGKLFARSVLRRAADVGPGDKVRGGVAMMASGTDVFVHPYVFRKVCSNGAIMGTAIQTRQISRDNWFLDPQCEGDLETSVRGAIRGCCEPEAFRAAVGGMRSVRETAADMALMVAAQFGGPQKSRARALPKSLWGEIMRRYEEDRDSSAYGVMNAVTSVARDTGDPETKWRLEELGGGIAMMVRKNVRRCESVKV